MTTRREKINKRILAALDTIEPKGMPGKFIHTPSGWASKKDRKASGWITPKLVHPQMKYKDIITEGLEPEKFYDEWANYRDGFRHNTATDQLYHEWRSCCCHNDEKVYTQNHKIIKQIQIRKAKLLTKHKSKRFK